MNIQLSVMVAIAFVLACFLVRVSSEFSAISCNSCGEECADACGTRHFRTCCFNYLRKRSPSHPNNVPNNNNIVLDNQQKRLWMLSPQIEKILKVSQLQELQQKPNELSPPHLGKYLSAVGTESDQTGDWFFKN